MPVNIVLVPSAMNVAAAPIFNGKQPLPHEHLISQGSSAISNRRIGSWARQ
jgi:hypothetical protein